MATGIPSARSSAQQLVAVLGAEMDVQQHDGGPLTLDRRLGFGKCRRFADREPLELEVDADEDTDCRVVVDDERAKTSFHCVDANDYHPLW